MACCIFGCSFFSVFALSIYIIENLITAVLAVANDVACLVHEMAGDSSRESTK